MCVWDNTKDTFVLLEAQSSLLEIGTRYKQYIDFQFALRSSSSQILLVLGKS